MLRLAAAAVSAALLVAVVGAQDNETKKPEPEKKKKASRPRPPAGTWTKSEGEAKVVFAIHANTLRCTLTEGEKKLIADADISVTRDHVLFGRISKVEKKGVEEGPTEGSLFSFRYTLKEGTLTISDLNAPQNGQAKALIEGDYKGGPSKRKNKRPQ